jgi:hypothetical protein
MVASLPLGRDPRRFTFVNEHAGFGWARQGTILHFAASDLNVL